MGVDRKGLRVISGGKSRPPEPLPIESLEKRMLRDVLSHLQMAREMNSLNTHATMPWVTVKRAQLVDEDLGLAEKVLSHLIQTWKG